MIHVIKRVLSAVYHFVFFFAIVESEELVVFPQIVELDADIVREAEHQRGFKQLCAFPNR